jgi:hypothetical protein
MLLAPAASAPDLTYQLTITPAQPVLGEEITATLECIAGSQPVEKAVTFEHASLTLVVQPQGAGEPAHAFPNRRVLIDGDLLIREAAPGGVEKLAAGERRSRSLELTRLFPRQLLGAGEVDISYTVYDGAHLTTSPVVHVRITSSPESVEYLLGRLRDSDLGVRRRAAALLHRMTAQELAFDAGDEPARRDAALARWTEWWHVYGARLKWAPTSDGVVSSGATGVPPYGEIGGVVYVRRPMPAENKAAWTAALRAWTESSARAALQGERLVADRQIAYPGDAALIAPDEGMLGLLSKALARAPLTPQGAEAALVLLSTAARMPDRSLAPTISQLRASMPQSPLWSQARAWATGLLDLLAPDQQS